MDYDWYILIPMARIQSAVYFKMINQKYKSCIWKKVQDARTNRNVLFWPIIKATVDI